MPDLESTQYWAQVFTLGTWNRFVKAGASITGFRETRWNQIQRMKPGDRILCYISGVSRFVGVLEVVAEPYIDLTPVWDEDLFPCRVPVRLIVAVPQEHAIPIRDLRELSIFRIRNWSLYLVASPSRWNASDGNIVLDSLTKAARKLENGAIG